ncbi:hypothetical protein [Streptomyces acidiscabies]|uniref:Uncharacterized protein n=1 Tax=Streptomyces acidiscabies TaxID=42234 RepID=A0A0L0JSK1_9ACTN|nr:hypothetical protein [Streptomyces acidiscabies]KND28474.1 hypothetical protein IQ63_33155 [Streptomyces acidiscabies]
MTAHGAVRVRVQGEVDKEEVARVLAKLDAACGRLGLAAEGALTVVRAAARHIRRPWFATARLLVDGTVLVVHAEEATARELADRLEDRVLARAGQAAHRRTHLPPPWRTDPGT